jgi:hypothetical protein
MRQRYPSMARLPWRDTSALQLLRELIEVESGRNSLYFV